MENNKYYVPEISEFHVGFEYQFNHKDKGWIDLKFGDTDDWSILEIDMEIENNEIRVKYLDQSDIESLGWLHDENRYKEYDENFWKCYRLKNYYLTLGIHKSNINPYKIIIDNGEYFEYNETYFQGTIKNKSELKVLMKQLGINE